MELFINKPIDHGTRLIAVASEKIKGNHFDYDHLVDKDDIKYLILDNFTISKEQPFPGGLMLLATGHDLEAAKVWAAYPKSNEIYLFIVKLAE